MTKSGGVVAAFVLAGCADDLHSVGECEPQRTDLRCEVACRVEPTYEQLRCVIKPGQIRAGDNGYLFVYDDDVRGFCTVDSETPMDPVYRFIECE